MTAEKIVDNLILHHWGGKFDDNDRNHLINTAEILLNKKWKVSDVKDYLCCTEEMNPNLDEDVAIDRMTAIHMKYKK